MNALEIVMEYAIFGALALCVVCALTALVWVIGVGIGLAKRIKG